MRSSVFVACANASVFISLLAASIRLASRLIAEGSAKVARPNHRRQSATSSMSVTHGHTSLSGPPPPRLSFHFHMLGWPYSLVLCPTDPILTRLSSRQALKEASCFFFTVYFLYCMLFNPITPHWVLVVHLTVKSHFTIEIYFLFSLSLTF